MQKNASLKILSPQAAGYYAAATTILFTTGFAANYSKIIKEPDFMFLDTQMLAFVFLCIASYLAGVLLFEFFYVKISRTVHYQVLEPETLRLGSTAFMFPMLASTIAALIAIVKLVLSNNLVALLISSVGTVDLKGLLDVSPGFFYVIYSHIAVTFWATIGSYEYKATKAIRALRTAMIATTVVATLLTLARYILLPYIMCLVALHLRFNYRNGARLPLKTIAVTLFLVIGLFSVIAVARGGSPLAGLYGYGPASFNRLSAVLDGKIVLDVPKSYFLLSTFKGGWTDFEITLDEHAAVGAAGLDWFLNWLTAYGYVYCSLGKYTCLYFMAIGLIAGAAWQGFLAGRSWAIVFYPWIFVSALLWFSYNILGYSQSVIILLVGLALSAYTHLFGCVPPRVNRDPPARRHDQAAASLRR